MLTFPSSLLSRKIIEVLSRGPLHTKEIILQLRKLGVRSTMQGIYKAIRSLKRDTIVLINKKEVAINQTWLQSVLG